MKEPLERVLYWLSLVMWRCYMRVSPFLARDAAVEMDVPANSSRRFLVETVGFEPTGVGLEGPSCEPAVPGSIDKGSDVDASEPLSFSVFEAASSFADIAEASAIRALSVV